MRWMYGWDLADEGDSEKRGTERGARMHDLSVYGAHAKDELVIDCCFFPIPFSFGEIGLCRNAAYQDTVDSWRPK
jgi:hypothetical protein